MPRSACGVASPRPPAQPPLQPENLNQPITERTMEVILLERVAKLGQMGEVVRVRDGFGRNYLLARGKALRATEENRKRFETQRAQLETRNLELKKEADSVAESLNGQTVVMLR